MPGNEILGDLDGHVVDMLHPFQAMPRHGQQVTSDGKAPGDVIVTASEKQHRIFKRKGNVLKCNIDITLCQSLCGFCAEITHLDGRVLDISSDEVTPHGHKFVIQKEGIPRGLGSLEVTVNVTFPKTIPEHMTSKLAACLTEINEFNNK